MPTANRFSVGPASAAARSSSAAVAAWLIAAACVTAPWAQPQTQPQTVSVSPNQAESGKPFQVTLAGKSGLCAPIFSRHEVKSENGVLNLTVMGVSNPAALCMPGEHEYRTDFNVPAIKAGAYEVAARLLPACSYENPPCMPIRDPVEYGGALEVRDSADLHYAFRPKRVEKDKVFGLFVFHEDFTCGNEYSNPSINVSGHSLNLSFTNRPHPETPCPAVLADYGPTFQVPAMPPGVYQVFVTAMPYCGTQGPCPLAMVAPQLSGALTVGEGAVSLQPAMRQAAKEKPGSGTGRLSIDNRLGVRGWWHAAAVSLTGRRANGDIAGRR
jgi:hypothetical protein